MPVAAVSLGNQQSNHVSSAVPVPAREDEYTGAAGLASVFHPRNVSMAVQSLAASMQSTRQSSAGLVMAAGVLGYSVFTEGVQPSTQGPLVAALVGGGLGRQVGPVGQQILALVVPAAQAAANPLQFAESVSLHLLASTVAGSAPQGASNALHAGATTLAPYVVGQKPHAPHATKRVVGAARKLLQEEVPGGAEVPVISSLDPSQPTAATPSPVPATAPVASPAVVAPPVAAAPPAGASHLKIYIIAGAAAAAVAGLCLGALCWARRRNDDDQQQG